MHWNQNHISHFFQTDDAFENNYCDDLTLAPVNAGAVKSRMRILAKRLAILMPDGAHRSPGFAINPRPWLVVSCPIGPTLQHMDGDWRVATFFSNHEFFVGFHCKTDAINLGGLREPAIVTNAPNLGQYAWTRIRQTNDHLCIQIPIPEDGQFVGTHPLADGQPFALALQAINANKFSTVDPEWISNYLVARGEPADGVIVPSVTHLPIVN